MKVRFTPNDINIIPQITLRPVPKRYAQGVFAVIIMLMFLTIAAGFAGVRLKNDCEATGGAWVTPEGARKHIKTCLKVDK